MFDLLAVFYGEIAVRGGTSPATAIVAPQFYGQIILPIDRQKWLFFIQVVNIQQFSYPAT